MYLLADRNLCPVARETCPVVSSLVSKVSQSISNPGFSLILAAKIEEEKNVQSMPVRNPLDAPIPYLLAE